ncbi:MAG TPA: hypothetical protein DEQ09_06895 [Bacteroidales bacterium]|nr:hypothetical protein [Bacteroidales bacterium]
MSKNNETKSESLKIKEFIFKVFSYKYYFISSIILLGLMAFLLNKFTPAVYEVNSIIGPVENKQSSLLESSDIFSGLGSLSQSRNLENDINSLKSFSLISETIKNLALEIGYFIESDDILGQVRQVYPNSHYTVNIDKSHIQPINARFYINIVSDTTYRLTVSEDDVSFYNYLDNKVISAGHMLNIDTVYKFNQTIASPYFRFSVSKNQDYLNQRPVDEERSFFMMNHIDIITEQYLNRLTVESVSLKSTLINVFFQGENLDLTVDFLNTFLQTYLDNNLSKKNTIALNTVNFIDSQISEISESLSSSQSELRDYRSTHQVTDLSYQGQQALNQMEQIDNEKATLQAQQRYYNYIIDYFNNNQDIAGLAPPSAANVSDPIMNTLVLELLDLNSQRSAILSNNVQKSLFLEQIENKINLQKQTIIENVKNNLNTLSLTLNELDYRAEKLSSQIARLPRTELNMVSMQRQYNITDAIYTFMLQKRSEAGIAMASNHPDYEVLESARSITSSIIKPKKMINYIASFFLGLLIPSLIIILKDFFNEKITRAYEIEDVLGKPVLSTIYNNSFKYEDVVHKAVGSPIAESFRNLRSNLFFRSKTNPLKVILVTSCQPQDGKSFVAMNLASSIASVGHKTIILDCDLRRPTLHDKFKIDNEGGITKYLTDKNVDNDIILKTFVDNLDFIPAGPVLPNSSELIEAGALDKLIQYLEDNYEYIIIDTTPSGMVADAAQLIKYSSINLLVCRNNHTRKDVFNSVLNFYKTHNIENFDIIYNDVEIKESRYGRYHGYYKKPKAFTARK